MAKSLILAVVDVADSWYNSLVPLLITSWQQLKAELLSTFQGYQTGAKTTRDLMNCVQRDDEPLAEYIKRFILPPSQKNEILRFKSCPQKNVIVG